MDQSSRSFFFQRGRGCRWSTTFPIFDLWIRFGEIRDQSRKLSEIAKNFGWFFCPPNCTCPWTTSFVCTVCCSLRWCDRIPHRPRRRRAGHSLPPALETDRNTTIPVHIVIKCPAIDDFQDFSLISINITAVVLKLNNYFTIGLITFTRNKIKFCETHYLQTCKHDIRIVSSVTMNNFLCAQNT